MFKRYFLVELFGTNGTKSARSNCVLCTRKLKPPIEIAYQNMMDAGFCSVNILSVVKINKKTADFIKDHVNKREAYTNKAVGDMVKKVEESMKAGVTQTTSNEISENSPTV